MDAALTAKKVTAFRQIQNLVSTKEGKFVLCFLATALLLRLFLIRYQYVINTDGVYYAVLGRKLITGDLAGGMSTYWSPLYPLLIGVSSLFFNDLEFAGRFVSVCTGTLLIIPTYLLIHHVYGSLQALVGAFLVAVYPPLVNSSTQLMTEPLYVLIFTTGLLTGWYALRSNKALIFFFTGLLYGAAYLTKPEAIGFVGLLLALAIGAKLRQTHLGVKKLILNSSLLIIGFLILSLPYIVYLHQKTGRWTISQKLVNNISAVDNGRGLLNLTDDGQATNLDRLYGETYQLKNQLIAPQPAAPQSSSPANFSPPSDRATQPADSKSRVFFVRTFSNLKKELKEIIPQIFPYLFLFFAVIGLFRRPWTRRRTANEIYLLLFLSATVVGYALTFVEERYLLPVLPILICWASNGIVEFEHWIIETSANLGFNLQARSSLLRAGVLTIAVLSLLPSLAQPIRADKWTELPFEQKQAGLWLRHHTRTPAPTMMSCGPWAAYYAEGRHLYLPNEQFAAVLAYANRQQANYLVVSERCSIIMPTLKNSPLGFLLDEQNAPPELKLVYKNDEIPAYKILVYELTAPAESETQK